MKISIVNGPNLKYIGQREPDIYGNVSLDNLKNYINQYIKTPCQIEVYQSNSEGALIDYLETLWENEWDGIVINAGAYTHTSIALADCLSWIKLPYVEVHLSNIYARETFRHKSFLSAKAIGVICGFGIYGYVLGVQALIKNIEQGG
ncbi:MAG: type II 3-dehydroquinate dehydratase [Desulfonauticus sp.]|nr:type II 3-dehydroquinate dehydratase [Desulfonauticus sp.]